MGEDNTCKEIFPSSLLRRLLIALLSFLSYGSLWGHGMHLLVLQGNFPIGAGGVVALEMKSRPKRNVALALVSFSWEECC
jgi:hypothetical protein